MERSGKDLCISNRDFFLKNNFDVSRDFAKDQNLSGPFHSSHYCDLH